MRTFLCALLCLGRIATGGDAVREKSDWWSFRPAAKPEIPQVEGIGHPIDAFIRAKLSEQKLEPSPEADRRTLLRRLSFDLTGLPPSPDEVEAFANDRAPDAYERLVDRLLASPRYGERWARHWLDVVHFGETHGYDKDKLRPNAWPYRDYVIRAFNEDKPYARFVEEQLAGDVLWPEFSDAIVATGFIAAGPWDFVGHVELPESKTDGLIARYNDRDDMVMTAMSTFESFTVHCARCHDHKFDPITQRDYYNLQAVFTGVDRADCGYDSDPAVARTRATLTRERQALKKRDAELRATDEPQRLALKSEAEALAKRLGQLDEALATLPPPQLVYAAAKDFAPNGSFTPAAGVRAVHLLSRGDVTRPKELAQPAALPAVPGPEAQFALSDPADEGARRAALARWMTDPRNLQTRRSIVNRVWQYHFGRGIVETPNDFGHMGALPTHPELLDWLAFWFLENGESFKKLHKLLVTSAAYRQVSAERPDFTRTDSENRWLWRMHRPRLDAECARDAMLVASGRLDLRMGGPSDRQFAFKDDHSPVYDYARFDVDSAAGSRRSIYRLITRSVAHPFLDCLDAADPSLLVARRNTTLTALQALAALNDPFVVRQAEHLAARAAKESSELDTQIARIFRLCLSRAPSAGETEKFGAHARQHGLANVCRLVFNSNEFMFID